MAKTPPKELANLEGDGPATAVEEAPAPKMEVETVAKPGPKMELTQVPAGSVVTPPLPGMFAPAPVAALPSVEVKHYLDVFEHMRPVPAGPNAPGVWLNYDGTPYQPRQREGGQFSVLRVEFQNLWKPEMRRVIVLPLAALREGEYGHDPKIEKVLSLTEVKFDFQDQMTDCLKAHGRKPDPLADHLANSLRAQGVASGARFDDPNLMPGLTPLRR